MANQHTILFGPVHIGRIPCRHPGGMFGTQPADNTKIDK